MMLWLLQLPLLLIAMPVLLLCAQLLAALPARRPRSPLSATRPALAVLVPAHNEEAGIAKTLASIQCQLAPTDCLLVVADNCDDNTATIARAAGAMVAERRDTQLRGKAYALAFGLRCLAPVPTPPAIVICIDADCTLDDHALDWLAHCCTASGHPAQARYLMHVREAPSASPSRLVAEFAWRVKNQLRALGRERLGMACQLAGSGMAFPWSTLQGIELEHHLAEDLSLGLALAAAGHAPIYCHDAVIHSSFPNKAVHANDQRTRWEHGHLQLLTGNACNHLLRAIKQRDWQYVSLALDLCIPPLSMLLILIALAAAVGLLAYWLSHEPPWLLLAVAPLPPTLLATWLTHGRDLLPVHRLPGVFLYLLAKLPLYLRFITNRQRNWIRAGRD